MSLLNGNNKKGKKNAKTANNNNAAANKFAGKANSKGAAGKSAVRTGGTRGS